MSDGSHVKQEVIAARFGVRPQPPLPGEKVGVSRSVRDGAWPLNGMRHSPAGDTCGWYIWAGEELSSAHDFFVPIHAEHLPEWCPAAVPYLALGPGWRFLLAPDYEDVWFDESLVGR